MRAPSRATTEVWHREGERFGPYVVHEPLGTGGMALVHRAAVRFEAGPGKPIALKRLRPELAGDPAMVEAFVREAELALQLRHPHIVEAYAQGELDGTSYLAMELVPGPTLAQILTQSRTAAGAVPVPVVIAILVQLCDALAHVHQLGIIHRDISPANVIVSNAGVVKVIDFGIAKDRRPRAATRTGIIKGRLGYIAPEYTFGKLDARADLFAVGVIAHELLTGEPLFETDSRLATFQALRQKPIQPPSRRNAAVSRELDDIVLTALQRDPAQRWQNAAAMRFALRALGTMAGRAEIRAWTEWAFAREPRRDSSQVGRMIDALDRPTPCSESFSPRVEAAPPPIQPHHAPRPRRAATPRAPARIDTQLVARLHRGPSAWWLVVIALAIAAACVMLEV